MDKIYGFWSSFFLWLQLEWYHWWRYLRLMYKDFFFLKGRYRQELVWTKKMVLVSLVAHVFFLLFAGIAYVYGGIWRLVVAFFFFPLCIVLAWLLISPLDWYLKQRILSATKSKLAASHMKVIWITGSYGKTSMKEVLQHVLWWSVRVLTQEGNLNTPLWIAQTISWIDLHEYDVFVVEMWAFLPWDIKKLCELCQPDIWIITWITKQHLERMWSLEAIARTKWEMWEYLLTHWWDMFVNFANEPTRKVLHTIWVNETDSPNLHSFWWWKVSYLPAFAWITWNRWDVSISVPHLWSYIQEYCDVSLDIMERLWFFVSGWVERLQSLPFIKHRLEPIKNEHTWVMIIDDSYNGNIAWVYETLSLMNSQDLEWRKIYLTPGLVELWEETVSVHEKLWKELVWVFDLFMFIDTKGTQVYKETLLQSWVSEDAILMYSTAQEAHASLWNILVSWDCVVFQNDATDNYS